MGIDWFTFVAQIINFMILVFLLRRFLYEPIVRVMNQRKQKIKASLLEAEEKIIQAEQESKKYYDLTEQLEQQKAEILAQAKMEAEQTKTELLREIREEIAQTESQWYQNLEQQKERFIRDLQQRTSQEVYKLLNITLTDLANVQLEEQIIEVFLERLKTLDIATKNHLIKALQESSETIIIETAFEINLNQKQTIIQTIEEELGLNPQFSFQVIPDLICGIKLIAVGREIAWNLENYLQSLEAKLNQNLLTQ
jgi:F-type H+-transporting ATPase subunit b